jgi:hypothetical protein
MQRSLAARNSDGTQVARTVHGFPDECPRCHSKVVPSAFNTVTTGEGGREAVEEGFQCANNKCGRMFISVYRPGGHGQSPNEFYFAKSIPLAPRPPVVSEFVAEVSPTFLETYSQALAAEGYGLTQLTGIGLRKALEFLVKDFSLREHPKEQEKIAKKTLASCINDYIADPNLKATAKRATWLGNDETHYIRKWEDKDISDLKVLIKLAVNWMENVLLTQKYVSEMPDSPTT